MSNWLINVSNLKHLMIFLWLVTLHVNHFKQKPPFVCIHLVLNLLCAQKLDREELVYDMIIFVFRPRLKNVDRSSAQHLEVTVGDLTVIITDFKEKTKPPAASSAASADPHSQSGSSSDNTERGLSRSSSPRGEASSLNGESH